MRIKNKEIKARRHRKEQKIKESARDLRAQYGQGKTTAEKPTAPKKVAAKPAAKKETAPKTSATKKPATKAKKAEPKPE